MLENKRRKKHLTSFQVIILGFAGVILIGTLLLMLPVSSEEGLFTPFDEALFTATSAVCVTGLILKDTGSYWSVAGQTIILLLIQIGGLGVVTVAASIIQMLEQYIDNWLDVELNQAEGNRCQHHRTDPSSELSLCFR